MTTPSSSARVDLPSRVAVPLNFRTDAGRVIVGSDDATAKSHILHCNYYNTYLQRTLWLDAGHFIDSASIIIGAAAEQARLQLATLFNELDLHSIEDRKSYTEHFYSWQGFGAIDLSTLSATGGDVPSAMQHYAEGWKAQFGSSQKPVGLMTQGWLAGAADAIFDLKSGTLKPCQTLCAAVSGEHDNLFHLGTDGASYPIYETAGVGPIDALPAVSAKDNNIDADAVKQAILTLPLFGEQHVSDGLIDIFGVLISWHTHNYYDRISFECLRAAMDKFGDEGRQLMEPLLEEAGHRCAFRTFGGIWRSAEWAAVVEPMCKTTEDWVHGMVAIINCAGWGKASCTELSPDSAVFVVRDDYESAGYMNLYGQSDFAPNYLMRGGFRGIMNLVYNGDITSKPNLTEDFYEQLNRHQNAFDVEVVKSRAMGDSESVFRVFRKSCQ